MKLELPPPEIRGVAVCIHPACPAECPICGGSLSGCEAEKGVSVNVAAWKCKDGHRTHAFVKEEK